MKKIFTNHLSGLLPVLFSLMFISGCINRSEQENEEYDAPDKASEFQRFRTRDLSTGKVPTDKMWEAVVQTQQLKDMIVNSVMAPELLAWTERGPYSDVVGPSNGNTRANNGVTSGRIDALWVDLADATGKTVWIGADAGGLWKTTDISQAPATWNLVNDFFGNLFISAITQDPTNHNVMYFSTGEAYYGGENGIGVFKSTDHGVTWTLLPSTTSYVRTSKMLCDNSGNVYLATYGNGLLRSTNGGNSWTDITPNGLSNRICDLELSSTGRMHVVVGINSAQDYRFTDIPATVTSSSGWTAPTTTFVSGSQRAEIGVSGNILFALPCISNQVPTIWKSVDGGANWATSGSPPASAGGFPFANGQAWYDLAVAINPSNPNECIIGGIDNSKTTDGGLTWTRISNWVGTTGQYVHADQHTSIWYDNGNKFLFGCDGGIHYTENGGTTIRDRNVNLRLKEFYSCAIHPTTTNYFLAGAQDNGTHQLTSPGLSTSVEVLGGDGGYCAIDQDQPQFQVGTYVYSNFRRSANGGATWTGGPSNNNGLFINPFDYDNLNNRVYAGYSSGQYLRWENPQSGFTYSPTPISNFGGTVASVFVSPYTANRVYFGITNGRIVRVDNAEQVSPGSQILATPVSGGYLNCINAGSDDQHLVATYTNFGITNVWVSTDGGTTWNATDGNLPNMPVYWAMFHPDDDTKMFIATETGVWETDLINGASTNWTPSPSFPTVRTTMLKYRTMDRTLLASTYGRGLWTSTVPLPVGFSFSSPVPTTSSCPAGTSMQITLNVISNGGFSDPVTLSASGNPGGTTVSFSANPVIPTAGSGTPVTVTLNGTNTLNFGSYLVTVLGTASGVPNQTRDLTYTIIAGTGPAITSPPSNQTICAGANTSFSITSASATSFQWQLSTDGGANYNNLSNGGVYSGATTNTLNITGATAGMNNYRYRCVASAQCGSTTSSAATLTVNTAPAITGPPSSISICNGNSTTLSVTATGAGLTYQWQSAPACGGPWTNVGTNSASLNVNPTTTTSYQVIISGTCTPPVTSSCATVTVVDPPSITTHPLNATACEPTPGTASFSVVASGAGIIYQWQLSTNGGGSWSNVSNGGVYSGATTSTLSITGTTPAMNGYQYRVQLTNATCTTPVTSNPATLTVNTVPSITAHPQGATLCVGNNITFNVTATGTGLTYQWRKGGVNIGGANSSSYTINGVTTADAGSYDVVVSGACPPPATSNAAILTVNTPITITTHPAAVNVCATGNASFSVVAAGTSPTYQWQESTNGGTSWNNITNGGVYSGATTATLTLTNVTADMSGNLYRNMVTGAAPCGSVNSNSAALNVTPQPVITASPFTSLLPGRITTLSVNVTPGPNLTFQWFLNGSPIPSPMVNSVVATVTDLGNYHVTITNTISGVSCTSQIQNIKDSVSDRLFIFPSPNNGQFTVSYYNASGSNTNRTVTVYDSHGAQVYNSKFGISGPYTLLPINLGAAQSGVYIVVVGDANGKKLIEGKVLVNH